MSTEKHAKARLPEYRGPYFTDDIRELHQLFDQSTGANQSWVNKVARSMGGEITRALIHTSDKYQWYWAITFHYRNVVILIPYSQDAKKQGGSHADRSIALYAKCCSNARANQAVRRFKNLVKQHLANERAEAAQLESVGECSNG